MYVCGDGTINENNSQEAKFFVQKIKIFMNFATKEDLLKLSSKVIWPSVSAFSNNFMENLDLESSSLVYSSEFIGVNKIFATK